MTAEQTEIVAAVRAFVDRDVDPGRLRARARGRVPEPMVETMREMGLFGTTIPEEYGGLGLGLDTYALIVMELSRGWVTLSGILNGSFIAATMIAPARDGGAAAAAPAAARRRWRSAPRSR